MFALSKLYSNYAVKNADSRSAFIWWEKAAELGYPEAQFYCGTVYEWGKGNSSGGKSDAIQCYIRGANNQSTDCMFKLGVFNEFGDGMPKNYAKVLYWYRLATFSGNKYAQTALERLHSRLAKRCKQVIMF